MGKLASIPVVVQTVNAANKTPAARKLMDSMLGIHAERKLPEYDSHKFRPNARVNSSYEVRDGARAPGKVAIYATCYINYNEPGIGHDLLKVLGSQRDSGASGGKRGLLRHAEAGTGRSAER